MFDNITPTTIKAGILAELKNWSTIPGSFAEVIVSAAAFEIWRAYAAMDALVSMFYVDETSGEYIDKMAGIFGVERKSGARATAMLTCTGREGLTIPARSAFLTAEGLCFLTDAAVTLADGEGQAEATAEAEGVAYNVAADSIVSSRVAIGGLSSTKNVRAAVGGLDPETDAALVARFYERLRASPTSGNPAQYRAWALEVTGVGAAKVLPLADGPGTVTVLLASPASRTVDSGVVQAVKDHIEAERPIGAAVTVVSAQELAVNVSATVTVDKSTTKEAVAVAFSKALAAYLRELTFSSYTVNYNRIAYILLSIPGVADYSRLTVNGGESNITIGERQLPAPGTVEVS